MPPNHFESEVESFLEGSHGDRTHIKRADHHTVTPLCGTLLGAEGIACDFGGGLPIGQCRESFVPVEALHAVCPESFVPWVCAVWLVCGGLREKIRPASSACVESAIFFAQRGQNGPKWAFCSLPGEFFRGCGREGCLLGEFCRALRHCGKA